MMLLVKVNQDIQQMIILKKIQINVMNVIKHIKHHHHQTNIILSFIWQNKSKG